MGFVTVHRDSHRDSHGAVYISHRDEPTTTTKPSAWYFVAPKYDLRVLWMIQKMLFIVHVPIYVKSTLPFVKLTMKEQMI